MREEHGGPLALHADIEPERAVLRVVQVDPRQLVP
jgi:hypothetical protein